MSAGPTTSETPKIRDSLSVPSATMPGIRRGWSIQLRLLVLVLAAALPPVLFSISQVRAANRHARQHAEEVALQLAQRIATRIDDHVSVIDALLLTLTRAVRTDPGGRAANDALLSSLSRDLGNVRILSLAVVDTLGNPIGHSNSTGSNPPFTTRDRKYFRDAMVSGGLGIGEPMVGRVTGQPSLAMGRAIIGADGVRRGVVAASTTLDQLRRVLIPENLPNEAVVTLLDQRGVVLARTRDADRWVGRDISNLSTTRETLAQREGVREVVGVDGIRRLSGFSTATRAPWHVYVGIPNEVALKSVKVQEGNAFALGLASMLVSVGLAWFLSRRIAGPAMALTADADAFASGNLAHRSAVDADGELGQLVDTFNRMAAAQQRRSDQLTESEQRFRTLFDTTPLPMWTYDVETLRFLDVNQTAIERYGYSREEFAELTIRDIRPTEDVPRLEETIRELHGHLQGTVWHHRTKAGEILDVEVTSDEMERGHRLTRLVVVIDVTARRRTEAALRASQEQLRQSQKMEAIGSLAGGIAHDFNNLLTAILGYCDLALGSLPADTGAHDDVNEIRRAAQRAAELTHQLLAFSRRQVLKPTVFDLNTVVQGTEKILRRLVRESIVLELALTNSPQLVRADPSQVEQVIVNLAVNAGDAMPRGGRLLLVTEVRDLASTHDVSGGTLSAGRYAVLSVTDTGTGIDPAMRDRLFEPFFTTKERGQGTGLGLATVYGIIQQSGGGIDVQSVHGEGATFTVYFPLAAADAPPAIVPPVSAGPSRGHGTILLAEDDDAVRAIARTTLERAGYHVLAACDGAAAIAAAESHVGVIDLLLTDVIMPGMNGRELAECMTTQRPGLPVLFVSGYTDNVLADLGLQLGAATLLDKPFTPASLTAAVAVALGTRLLGVPR